MLSFPSTICQINGTSYLACKLLRLLEFIGFVSRRGLSPPNDRVLGCILSTNRLPPSIQSGHSIRKCFIEIILFAGGRIDLTIRIIFLIWRSEPTKELIAVSCRFDRSAWPASVCWDLRRLNRSTAS